MFTNYVTNHPVSTMFVGLYLLITAIIGLYALTCSTQWCSLVLVIPLTPWPQLESVSGLNLPRVLLPVGVLLNSALLFFAGRTLEKVFNINN